VAPRNLLKYKDCGGWYEGLVKIGLLKEIQPDRPAISIGDALQPAGLGEMCGTTSPAMKA
jgi:hypothetical protein